MLRSLARAVSMCVCLGWLMPAVPAAGAELFVAPGAGGNGTKAAPFGHIQDAIDAARAGDVVTIAAGTYHESLITSRGGSASLPLTIRAAGNRGSVIVTSQGRVLTVTQPYVVIEALVFDGQYGSDDAVRVATAATGFTLRDCEVRRSGQDAVDIGSPSDVLIDGSLIHNALNSNGGRTDAHGIVAGAVHRLTIRNTEIHTFSGDAIQVDPGRQAPGWSDVLIEGCKLWLEPLPTAENGFPAGTVPGENALDTKANSAYGRATITVRDTEAWGFRNGLITNMAAFNLKENIDAVLDGVTVHDSEIAFRLRGPSRTSSGAWVRIQNAVVFDAKTAFRYEDNVQNLRIWNSTVGAGVGRTFQAASSTAAGLDVRNLLVLGTSLPKEAAGGSNLAVPASSFVSAAGGNYQLAPASPAIDAGTTLSPVTTDRAGTHRPQGRAYDIGAYEHAGSSSTPAGGDVVLYAAHPALASGSWQVQTDTTAAGGLSIGEPDEGQTVASALDHPVDYFELTFPAEAGRQYRVWVRGRADRNLATNDSVFVQFSDSVNANGHPVYRIGSSSAATVILKECASCPLDGWGWQDDGHGLNVLGPAIYFGTAGEHRIRIQTREDGMAIDQIVISSDAYLSAPPGAPRNDATVLAESGF